MLNALGRMAFGWGPPPDPNARMPKHEAPETDAGRAASERFAGRGAQLAVVLDGAPSGALAHAPSPPLAPALPAAGITLLLALAFAAAALFGHRLPRSATALRRIARLPLEALRALHDGVVTDYVAWLAAGAAAMGAALAALVTR